MNESYPWTVLVFFAFVVIVCIFCCLTSDSYKNDS